ncbi:MAG TPA: succinate dehydrogenase, hydrophobic membrane anchor protein [Ktedonobacteraceae bacterium]|jgi:succinate dehydrogenase / fumarate reductase membrane anchor subunit|nr:succinate dehydrogenase, hydrophobic membrane anchor protein [Ktedonobacteraceae bacterium]
MMRISTGKGPRPAGGGFETFSWYYFRVSGIVLVFLVITHLIIMHASNDVACTTYAFVVGRYANPFWRVFDWLLLTLGLTHGMNGLRIVIDDYIRNARTRLAALSIVGVMLIAFFMLGTITLITFPSHPAGAIGPASVNPAVSCTK